LNNKFDFFFPGQNIVDLGFAPGTWTKLAIQKTKYFNPSTDTFESINNAKILGVDILPSQPPNGASAIQGNIFSKHLHLSIKNFFLYKSIQKIINQESIHESNQKYNKNLHEKTQQLNQETIQETVQEKPQFPVDLILSDLNSPWDQDTYKYWSTTVTDPSLNLRTFPPLLIDNIYKTVDLFDAALLLAIDILKQNGSFVARLCSSNEDQLINSRLKKVFEEVHYIKISKDVIFVCKKKKDGPISKLHVFT
ncbi:uncharacterized protein ASCRUDRAFT_17416, partial [Ascoidea rubescens DSM 1968]